MQLIHKIFKIFKITRICRHCKIVKRLNFKLKLCLSFCRDSNPTSNLLSNFLTKCHLLNLTKTILTDARNLKKSYFQTRSTSHKTIQIKTLETFSTRARISLSHYSSLASPISRCKAHKITTLRLKTTSRGSGILNSLQRLLRPHKLFRLIRRVSHFIQISSLWLLTITDKTGRRSHSNWDHLQAHMRTSSSSTLKT